MASGAAEDVGSRGGRSAGPAPPVPEDTQKYLDRSAGGGAPLPEEARRYFETRFKADFSAVRIHDDDGADRAAKSLQAIAFTRGNDIYFSAGAYDPVTEPGRKLLAHELTHVVQQAPGINRKVAPGPERRRPPRPGGQRWRAGGRTPKPPGTLSKVRVPDDLADADDATKAKAATGPAGEIDTASSKVVLDKVFVPAFKLGYHNKGALTWNKSGAATPTVPPGRRRHPRHWLQASGPAAGQLTQPSEPLLPPVVAVQAARLRLGRRHRPGHQPDALGQLDATQGTQLRDRPPTGAPVGRSRRRRPTCGCWTAPSTRDRVRPSTGPSDVNDFAGPGRPYLASPKLAKPPSSAEVVAKYGGDLHRRGVRHPTPVRRRPPMCGRHEVGPDAAVGASSELAKPEAVAPLVDMTAKNREKVRGSKKELSITVKRGGGSVWSVPFDATSGDIAVSKFFTGGGFKVDKGQLHRRRPAASRRHPGGFLRDLVLQGQR